MFTEFSNNELSTLAEQVRRSDLKDPLVQKLSYFLANASEIGGLSLVNVRLTAEIS